MSAAAANAVRDGLAVDAVEYAGVEAPAVDDQEADVISDERVTAFQPHHEKRALRLEAKARETALEGPSAQETCRDRCSRTHMDSVKVHISLVLGVEQRELPAL